jgi:hypothetical protein
VDQVEVGQINGIFGREATKRCALTRRVRVRSLAALRLDPGEFFF